METIVKGIVISVQNYGEFDTIAKIITPKRFFTVLALGTRKDNSKNRFGLILGTYGEFEIFASRLTNRISKLKKANALVSFEITNQENLLNFKEIFFQLNRLENTDPHFFQFLEKIWPLWGKNQNAVLLTKMLNQILHLHGIYPNFNACVECGSVKNIADFKYYKGGFLCLLHKTENLSLEKLHAFYYLNADFEKYLKNTSPKINWEIIGELKNFLDENIF